jgi:peptide/nickel transport system permease protein
MTLREKTAGTGILANLLRISKYSLVRAILLLITVTITVYLTIVIANFGGALDEFIKSEIEYALGMSMKGMTDLTHAEKKVIFEQMKAEAFEAAGFNVPFLLRCLRWLGRGLTLDWGETHLGNVWYTASSRPVRVVILENLPRSLLIFGTANVLLFFTTILIALPLTNKEVGWLDKVIITLSPLSAAPAWVYGIVLNFLSIKLLNGVLSAGTLDAWPNEFKLAYVPMLLKYTIMPTLAIFLSGLFQGIYTWRTFFQLYAREDYVELARAKGLRPRVLERRYILRPVLPSLITSFALLFVTLWQQVIILEKFFNVSGIGSLFVRAIESHRMGVIVAVVTTFAYMLAITVFILDIIYAIVDPRIKIGGQSRTVRTQRTTHGSGFRVLWAKLRERLARRKRRRRRRENASTHAPSLQAESALNLILGAFDVKRQCLITRSGTSGDPCILKVDRYYPALRMAVISEALSGSHAQRRIQRCHRAGIVVVTVSPDHPITPMAVRKILAGLDSAARYTTHSSWDADLKRSRTSRITEAKATCRRILDRLESPAPTPRSPNPLHGWKRRIIQAKNRLTSAVRKLAAYPAAVTGLLIIAGLIGLSAYTLITIPYPEMLQLWREDEDRWIYNPRDAAPEWVNLFRRHKLPPNIMMDSREPSLPVSKERIAVSEEMTEIAFSFPFDYSYDALPEDLSLFIDAHYEDKRPLITLTWLTPDGREIEVMSSSIHESYFYKLSQDESLQRKSGDRTPLEMILADPGAASTEPLKGTHEVRISAFVFEDDADVDVKFVLYGQVFGIAGTDGRRRDMKVPLLWGLPIALAFGLLAAFGTSLSSIVIAAVGTWFDGWVDALIQRITEVNMILPFLPVSIMIYVLYSKSFWVILGVTVLLSIFSSSIKNYRALFLQVREAPYIEAAQSYGASNGRIITRYLIPRIVSVLVPQMVIMVPSYVFLEASLAFLGVSDPVLPTWGKLIVNGFARGIYTANYHLVFEPLAFLMLVGFAFVMLGLSLKRIFTTDWTAA